MIVQKEDPVLRKKAHPVPIGKILSKSIQKILEDMKTAVEKEEDGVAIAAPQIGQSLRIFVVSPRAYEIAERLKKGEEKSKQRHAVFINPEILKQSKEKESMEEGCLSVRWLYGKVKRSKKVRIRAYGQDGKAFETGGSGVFAQIYQHETDHLNGILFTDKASQVESLPPSPIKNK